MSHVPRVVFMGTPDFSVPILRSLVDHSYEVAAVITQPDKPAGRKRKLTPPPVKMEAQRLGLSVLQPKKVREEDALQTISDLDPDVIITAAYGQLLPQKLLDIPKVGCINVHASLLPRWRGAAPIHRALLQGDDRTGITLMEMVLELDAGPVLGVRELPIDVDDTVGTLHDKLSELGSELVISLLPDYLAGKIAPTPQPTQGVTYANRILSEDEELDFHSTAKHVHNHVRGLCPWPGARTTWKGQRLKVWKTHRPAVNAAEQRKGSLAKNPGTVYRTSKGVVVVQCADGPLQLIQVQPAGKKVMSAEDWFRGLQTDTAALGEHL